MDDFDIPVVLFSFKRYKTALRVLERISIVRPRKLYLISDGPRNEEERTLVLECRKQIEQHVNWDCQIIKNYAQTNQGIYDRIGLGAKWVFSREGKAVFLEDDNLPEPTFFDYCRQMLEKYEDDTRVLWVCGTNYLGKYFPKNGASYMFTKHLLPCGWASWSRKFSTFYDGELELLGNHYLQDRIRDEYDSKPLYRQEMYAFRRTYRKKELGQPISWDFQMAFSVRVNGLYGISPICNQIKNIGVDEMSTHGGTSFRRVMTRRFCGMESYPLNFPLVHPSVVLTDRDYEKRIDNIILYPIYIRIAVNILKLLKPLFGINKYDSLTISVKQRISNMLSRS